MIFGTQGLSSAQTATFPGDRVMASTVWDLRLATGQAQLQPGQATLRKTAESEYRFLPRQGYELVRLSSLPNLSNPLKTTHGPERLPERSWGSLPCLSRWDGTSPRGCTSCPRGGLLPGHSVKSAKVAASRRGPLWWLGPCCKRFI